MVDNQQYLGGVLPGGAGRGVEPAHAGRHAAAGAGQAGPGARRAPPPHGGRRQMNVIQIVSG